MPSENKSLGLESYTNNSFPCLINFSAELEALPETSSPEYYHVNARNALRHLTYGTPLFKGSIFKWSNLKLAWLNFKAMMFRSDPLLLKALRLEMQNLLWNAYSISSHCDDAAQNRLEIFINTLLSNFPFMDPKDGEMISVPQRINGEWQKVKYQFKKIDLSPKTGWWSWLLEDEDRIYAYGMEPQYPHHENANPHLLLMGTTYFSGQGANLSLLGNLTPGQSVGERHHSDDLDRWIRGHQNILAAGHSQGGTLAMIIAAKYPEHIKEAACLNPAALHQATLAQLSPDWQARRSKTEIKVYRQPGDPVFIFGDGFLPGTQFFRVNYPESAQASLFAAHAHHYSGYQSATITEDSEIKIATNKRKFFNDMKAVADKIISPLLILNFIYSVLKRKTLRFCSQQAKLLYPTLFVLALIACVPLMSSPLFSLPLVAAATYLLPKLIHLAINLIQFTVGLGVACAVGVAFLFSGIVAGLCALKRACCSSKPNLSDTPRNAVETSTQLSLERLGRARFSKQRCLVNPGLLNRLILEEKQGSKVNIEPNSTNSRAYTGSQKRVSSR